MNILIIDTDREDAERFAESIPREGNEIKLAHSEREAQETVRGWQPQCVFVEVGRSELDGYAVAKQLREGANISEAIFVSISEFPQDHAREQAAGIDRHLRKPVKPQDLQAIIQF